MSTEVETPSSESALRDDVAAGLRGQGLLPADTPLKPASLVPEQHALFEAIDLVYLFHLLRLWPEASTAVAEQWARHIAAGQSATDGWFRGHDRQRHSPVHVTAYALGALCILQGTHEEAGRAAAFRPPDGLQLLAPEDAATLSMLERVHFWRGSHRVGGMLAIAAMLHQLGRADDRVPDRSRIEACTRAWMAVADPAHGGWTLAHPTAQWLFDHAFSRRHRPEHCRMGAAAHIYWPAARLGIPGPPAAPVIDALARAQDAAGRFERNPYCLDYDALCIGWHLWRHDPGASAAAGATLRAMAAASRDNVHAAVDDGRLWARGLHGAVGALAALGLAETILEPARVPMPIADPLEHAWWL